MQQAQKSIIFFTMLNSISWVAWSASWFWWFVSYLPSVAVTVGEWVDVLQPYAIACVVCGIIVGLGVSRKLGRSSAWLQKRIVRLEADLEERTKMLKDRRVGMSQLIEALRVQQEAAAQARIETRNNFHQMASTLQAHQKEMDKQANRFQALLNELYTERADGPGPGEEGSLHAPVIVDSGVEGAEGFAAAAAPSE